MTDAEKGMKHFGYNPQDIDCPETTRLTKVFDAAKTALKNNRDDVNAAKNRDYAGDWKSTRGVLRAISVVTGLYFTR